MSKHKARKRFGQNFLTDNRVIERIIATIAPKFNDNLLEIGPGQGAMTLPLLEARLSAVPWSTEVRIKGKPKVILTAFLKPKVFNTGKPWS
jgi:predicted LPLAT superfamily acyltransferase